MQVAGLNCCRCFFVIFSKKSPNAFIKTFSRTSRTPAKRLLSISSSNKKTFHLDVRSEESIRNYLGKLNQEDRTRLMSELQKLATFGDAKPDAVLEDPPDFTQLKQVCIYNAVPFIGFGFLDNLIMIIAGEYIDAQFGVVLGISTMAAAAWGNLVSDLAGLGLAGYVEHVAHRLGIKTPKLSPAQYEYKRTRWTQAIGRCLGISVGCIIGMFPFLFINSEEIEKEKMEEQGKDQEDTS